MGLAVVDGLERAGRVARADEGNQQGCVDCSGPTNHRRRIMDTKEVLRA